MKTILIIAGVVVVMVAVLLFLVSKSGGSASSWGSYPDVSMMPNSDCSGMPPTSYTCCNINGYGAPFVGNLDQAKQACITDNACVAISSKDNTGGDWNRWYLMSCITDPKDTVTWLPGSPGFIVYTYEDRIKNL